MNYKVAEDINEALEMLNEATRLLEAGKTISAMETMRRSRFLAEKADNDPTMVTAELCVVVLVIYRYSYVAATIITSTMK